MITVLNYKTIEFKKKSTNEARSNVVRRPWFAALRRLI